MKQVKFTYSVFLQDVWKQKVDRWFTIIAICMVWFFYRWDMGNHPMTLIQFLSTVIFPVSLPVVTTVVVLFTLLFVIDLFTKPIKSLPKVWLQDFFSACHYVADGLVRYLTIRSTLQRTILVPGYPGFNTSGITQYCFTDNGTGRYITDSRVINLSNTIVYERGSLLDIVLNKVSLSHA